MLFVFLLMLFFGDLSGVVLLLVRRCRRNGGSLGKESGGSEGKGDEGQTKGVFHGVSEETVG